jgi:hypothetical protein
MADIIPVVAIAAPFLMATAIVALKHKARNRDLEHTEKMKALELGITGGLSGNAGWPALIALGIGAVMPLGLFLFAWLAALTAGAREEVWITSMIVGFAGVVGGTRLGFRVLKDRAAANEALLARQDEARLAASNGHRKPAFNPDAYDAIAHRG